VLLLLIENRQRQVRDHVSSVYSQIVTKANLTLALTLNLALILTLTPALIVTLTLTLTPI